MTLREALMAQLPFQARLTHEVRLARAFTASALISASLAGLLAHARSFNALWAFGKIALLFANGLRVGRVRSGS